jgi:peptidoglycan/LPS O-acetylase OafA/YrhL
MDLNEKNNFDFLRFSLAFIVVIGHIIALSGISQMQFLKVYFDSNLAVKGFFIISGFLITKSFLYTSDIPTYFIKRARRLLPAYTTIILICAFLFSIISSLDYFPYFKQPALYKYLMANLMFLNFLQPCLPGVFTGNIMCAVNGALWTLKIEVSFYILLPMLVYFFQRVSKKYIYFLLIYILSVVYRYTLLQMCENTGKSIFDMLAHQLPGFMSYFISGIALYYYYPFFRKHLSKLILPAVLVYGFEYFFGIEVFRPLCMACILFYIAYNFKWLNNFGRYGDFSYGIYIYHFPIIQLFVSYGFFAKYNPWFISVIIVTIVMVTGIISWNVMEKKFLKHRVHKIK